MQLQSIIQFETSAIQHHPQSTLHAMSKSRRSRKRLTTKKRIPVKISSTKKTIWVTKKLRDCYATGGKWGRKTVVGKFGGKRTPCIRVINYLKRFDQSIYPYQGAWAIHEGPVPSDQMILHDCTMPITKLPPNKRRNKRNGKATKNSKLKYHQRSSPSKEKAKDRERYFTFVNQSR